MPPISVTRGEFAVAASIIGEAAQWLAESDQPLWEQHQVSEAALRKRCDPSSVLVAYDGGLAVAAALLEWRDDIFWPGVEDSGFIHRLAVRRSAAGTGYAEALLDWAAAEAAAEGKLFLRLDCLADRPRLCAFYERCGFERAGTVERGPWQNALYQRRAS